MSGSSAPFTVAVTGAGGFIGSRVALRLSGHGMPQFKTRALVRRTRATPPRGEIASIAVDLGSAAALAAAIDGCRAVVHCAFDPYDLATSRAIARAVGERCAATGARMVLVSSAAVHEPFPSGVLDETVSYPSAGTAYAHAKRAIEADLSELARTSGLDLIIVQPTIVYGPRGAAWTDGPVRMLLAGGIVLPALGLGVCNPVYVDDVAAAVVGAVTARPVTSGERFLVSGPARVPWRDFFEAYRAILGAGTIVLEDDGDAVAASATIEAPADGNHTGLVRQGLARLLRATLGPEGATHMRMRTARLRAAVGQARPRRPDAAMRVLLSSRCRVSIEKARAGLGYAPRYDLASGMLETSAYIRERYAKYTGAL